MQIASSYAILLWDTVSGILVHKMGFSFDIGQQRYIAGSYVGDDN